MMIRALCLLVITSLFLPMKGQDFVSKFMDQCSDKDSIQCQTISPKMMEKLVEVQLQQKEENNDEVSGYLLSKLKSARIITANKHCEKLFHKASQLIEKNKNRFVPLGNDSTDKKNQIFIRKHDDIIRELVMLSLASENHIFTIINFTGEMDDEFIESLSSGKLKEN